MRILINHLTRMHGGHICVAGIDLQTRRHVRPVLQQGGIPFHFLARYGGPFDMARIIDLGQPRSTPDAPHVEDCVFVPSRARVERTACAHEFWNVLHEVARTRLREIFGPALQPVGRCRCATPLGQGEASLGCLRPARPPELYLQKTPSGRPQIRIRISDGEINADGGITDLRLCQSDHATPDEHLVVGAARWISDSKCVILGVGLTRQFRRDANSPYFHWLQEQHPPARRPVVATRLSRVYIGFSRIRSSPNM